MSNGRLILGGILIIIGLSALTGIDIMRFIFPLFLIWLGWVVISGKKWPTSTAKSTDTANKLSEVLIFTGTEKVVQSKTFNGGKIIAIFGGAEFDLTNVKASKKDIKLELVAIFGSIKLRVPKSWDIDSDAVAIFGGLENKTKSVGAERTAVKVDGAAIFGGIEIGN